ncbi:MAG: hypothetical protein IAE85_12100 [Anaerolinea sp.]|nr:hypothetical protein [Anaerolinea sp.]
MTPKVPDTLSTRLRYCWYRLRISRKGVPASYSMFRQFLWLERRTP